MFTCCNETHLEIIRDPVSYRTVRQVDTTQDIFICVICNHKTTPVKSKEWWSCAFGCTGTECAVVPGCKERKEMKEFYDCPRKNSFCLSYENCLFPYTRTHFRRSWKEVYIHFLCHSLWPSRGAAALIRNGCNNRMLPLFIFKHYLFERKIRHILFLLRDKSEELYLRNSEKQNPNQAADRLR